jgi:release factor glutamine methyltransferase
MIALDGMEDGLYFYRKIISESWDYLEDQGWIFFEIGYNQGKAVTELLEAEGYQQVQVIKDLSGLDRVVFGIKRKI